MKTFKQFPIGTVRGPYTCGKGSDPQGGVQFMVRTADGWAPFIEKRTEEAKCRLRAEQFAATLENPSN